MLILPIDYFLLVWFVIAAASTVYVGIDQYRNNPEPTVMKWGFILVTLYMGPLGLLLYVMADKEPRPGEHEAFVKPLWRQGVGSTIHCVAGDATGIIVAAVVVALLGLPMWQDLIIEYLAGFAFGLFIFQSLFMKSMMGGTYLENVRRSFLPELISMNLMMGAMAPVMVFLMMGRDMRAMEPTELVFWGVMSLGVIAGFALAYPVNVWMVARNMKHGLMTERTPGGRFDVGGDRAARNAGDAHAGHTGHGAESEANAAMASPTASAGKTGAMKMGPAAMHGDEDCSAGSHTAMTQRQTGAAPHDHHTVTDKGNAGDQPMKPIHPALVHFPIALLALSVGADVLAMFVAGDTLGGVAAWALLGAAIGGIFTVLAGVFDMRRAALSPATHERVHRHMKVGFALASVIVVLAVWRWAIYATDDFELGWSYVFAAVLAVGLAAFQGWLGGELVYTFGVGVRPGSRKPRVPAVPGHAATKRPGKMTAASRKAFAGKRAAMAMDHSAMNKGKADGTGSGSEGGDAMSDATVPQLAAMAGVTLIVLLIGLVAPANFVNLRLSVRDVGGTIMPPGMIMLRDTPGAAMRDMSAIHPRYITAEYGLDRRGDQELTPRIENGVKVFDLETSVIRWQILRDVHVDAFAFNGQVPGPRLHFRQGDRVRINVMNRLPQSTTVHWHGLILPNIMDGPAQVTQKPIENGELYRYEFTAVQSGTYFYHSHDHIDRQQALGLYGAMIIDPADPADELRADHEYTVMLQEWLLREGLTYPAMPMEGGMPNYFTINGRAYPATDTIKIKVGETLKVRFIGSSSGFIHPMHIHGGPFEVVARDGETLAPTARFKADTINVGPGQRYDVIWKALKAGKWMIHCHISHHTTNNNTEQEGGGGLMMHIDVEGDPTK